MTTTTEHIDSYGTTFTIPGPYSTLESIKRANRAAGLHWFDPEHTGFLPLAHRPRGDRRPACSSRRSSSSPTTARPSRAATPCASPLDSGDVGTVGTFQEFRTLRAARRAAEALASGEPVHPSLP